MIFVPIRVHSWFCIFFPCISCVSWFNSFVSIRAHSWFWILFVYFVCFVVQPIRDHSCPFVSIRGSTHSWFCIFLSCISCFSWFNPFVSIRGSVFSFRVFRVFRGSTHSRPFVSIRGSSTSFSEKFSGNVGDDLFSVDLFLQLLLETKSYR